MSVLYKSGMRQSYKCCPIHHPEGLTSHLYRFRGQCLLYLFLTNRHHTGGLVVVVVVGIRRRSIIITIITRRHPSTERMPYYRYHESLLPTTTTNEECSGSGRCVPEKGHDDNKNSKDLYLHRHEYLPKVRRQYRCVLPCNTVTIHQTPDQRTTSSPVLRP